jgi:hypothetical protein
MIVACFPRKTQNEWSLQYNWMHTSYQYRPKDDLN